MNAPNPGPDDRAPAPESPGRATDLHVQAESEGEGSRDRDQPSDESWTNLDVHIVERTNLRIRSLEPQPAMADEPPPGRMSARYKEWGLLTNPATSLIGAGRWTSTAQSANAGLGLICKASGSVQAHSDGSRCICRRLLFLPTSHPIMINRSKLVEPLQVMRRILPLLWTSARRWSILSSL